MGAQTSTNRSNDVDYAIGTIYSTLTNAKCVAQLSWDDFVSLIAQLNIRFVNLLSQQIVVDVANWLTIRANIFFLL